MRKVVVLPWVVIFVLALMPPHATSYAASVPPTFVEGNPTCGQLVAGTIELKVEPPTAGVFTDGTLTVTISQYTGTSFDFTANIGVDAVFVKAGPGGNLYRYDPEVTSDPGL
jgi:hypothetical protein